MTQKNNSIQQIELKSLIKLMLTGAVIGFILISFLYSRLMNPIPPGESSGSSGH
jgi:RsiW-degrading membrane proteinase PrsW (M82 family)